MVEIREKICRIPGDARDISHEEWVKEVEKCTCDSVPVNEQDNFWTVGEAAWWIPKDSGNLSNDITSVIKRKRSELSYNKKRGFDTSYLQKLIDDLTHFVDILKE